MRHLLAVLFLFLVSESRGSSLRAQHQQHSRELRRRTARLLHSSAARHLIAGAAAGVVSNTAVAPLDILRLNLMVSQKRTSVWKVAAGIYADGGVRAFWKGNVADVLRTIPASAVRFYSFAVYKAQLPAYLALASITAPAATSVLAGGTR